MRGGFSGSKGFILYDTSKKDVNAVYGYYENEEIIIKKGALENLKDLQKQHDILHKREDNLQKRIMGIVLLVMFVMIVVSFFMGPFLFFISTLLFCVLSYFAWLVVFFAWTNSYDSKEIHQQFRRFHGAEHAVFHLLVKNEEVTLENLKKQSYFESECGTAYAGNWLFLSFVFSLLVLNIVNIGVLKALLYLFLTIVLLFINLFNPYNPFKLLQYNAVAQPTDKEYLLAIEIIKTLYTCE